VFACRDCAININELRGGQRHDKWLPLLNIKMGRVHLAITVLEGEDDNVSKHTMSMHGLKYSFLYDLWRKLL